jgi:hypothetical protein
MAISTTVRTFSSAFNTQFGGWINLSLVSTAGIAPFAITQNGTTTATSAVVTGLTSTANLVVGQPVSGTGIPANTTIASINSATQVTLSAAATASGTVAITFASTPLTITSALAIGTGLGVAGPIVVTPYQELPNLSYKCRIASTPSISKNYLFIRAGDTVTG